MTSLTARQRKALKSTGRSLTPAVIVGKAGLSEAVIAQVGQVLADRELVKVRLPAGSAEQRKSAAAALAESTGADLLATTGRTALLYAPNPDLPADRRVKLRS
jgi:RNA-binding protein